MAEESTGRPKRPSPAPRLARLSKVLSLLKRDGNLRSSVRSLLYHLGRIDEVSAAEFASAVSGWAKSIRLAQQYHDPSRDAFGDALIELYPDLARRIEAQVEGLRERPTITILTPAFGARRESVEPTLRSVRQQFYGNLKLYLFADRSSEAEVRRAVAETFGQAPPVEVRVGDGSPHSLAPMLDAALGETTGDFLALLSAGDRLARTALLEVAKAVNRRPEADIIYSDEEQVSGGGFVAAFRKPGWSPDLFLSLNYLRNLLCCRTEAVRAAGGFRGCAEGDIRYDLLLRMVERTQRVHHVPHVLYYEQLPKVRASPCAAHSGFKAQRQALEEHVRRAGGHAEVCRGLFPGSFRVRRKILGDPKVSIIIPTRDAPALLRQCVESVEARTSYRNFEIIVVDNDSAEPETLSYLGSLPHKVIKYPGAFNFSAINNAAVREAAGSHLLFLNDDTQAIAPDWLGAMLEHSQRPEVGAVGAKLLYPNGTIQHAGMGLDRRRIAVHLNRFGGPWEHGRLGLADVVRNVNAVTGACLMIKRSHFEEVGGFDENLAVHYNDVGLCLKVRDRGLLVVYTPFALLFHHEGVRTRLEEAVMLEGTEGGRRWTYQLHVPAGQADEVRRFYSRWRTFIENDDYYAAGELI